MRRAVAAGIGALVLAGCVPARPALPPPPEHSDGQRLWEIVHGHCVPNQRAHGAPAPCAEVSLAGGEQRGFAVLKDRNGASQYLLMPTALITGIEDRRLLAADAPDYFTPAWRARRLVVERLGVELPRDAVSIAINSRYGRSQDLLHLHVDCLRVDVREQLRAARPGIGTHWTRSPLILAAHPYRAMRIEGGETISASPFRLIAGGLHVEPVEMGAWTAVLVGAEFGDGRSGFLLLAARSDPAHGFAGAGEELQDHNCAAAHR